MDKRFLLLAVFLIIAVGLIVPMAIAKPGDRGRKACNDRTDNDGDGYTDFPDDPGCNNKQDNSELNPNIECDDGVDNADADSLVDYNDPGCSGPTDDDEIDGECDDTVDNDGDEATDYPSDGGCTGYSDNDETNCGDDVCEGGEDCDNCAADCLESGQVCCNGVAYWGDCCDDNDCTLPEVCVSHYCSIPDSCSDTDGGFVITVEGTVSGYSGGFPYSYTDFCNQTYLEEFYCIGNQWDSGFFDCSINFTSCSNGACV